MKPQPPLQGAVGGWGVRVWRVHPAGPGRSLVCPPKTRCPHPQAHLAELRGAWKTRHRPRGSRPSLGGGAQLLAHQHRLTSARQPAATFPGPGPSPPCSRAGREPSGGSRRQTHQLWPPRSRGPTSCLCTSRLAHLPSSPRHTAAFWVDPSTSNLAVEQGVQGRTGVQGWGAEWDGRP